MAFIILCIIVVPPQILVLCLHRGKFSYIIPRLFHRGVCRIFGIKVILDGAIPDQTKQTFYISNHLSYLDIPVIGSTLKASFVAKEDVQGWPVFGFLSKMQQTLFISRDRDKASHGQTSLDTAISQGKSLILFPEGTSTDGRDVYPFKSTLFSIMYVQGREHIPVTPMTISILSVNGQSPDDQSIRDLYAWHNNMDTPLGEHLWRIACHKQAIIKLTFHAPVMAISAGNRKELAKICHNAVSMGLQNSK